MTLEGVETQANDACDACDASPTRLSQLLGEVEKHIRRFIVCGDHEATVLALWVVHTHCIDAVRLTPYIAVSSPERGCGKSELLEILEKLVRKGWRVSGATPAVLFRKAHHHKPTMLIDEVDRLPWNSTDGDPIVAILNAGNKRGAVVSRCDENNADKIIDYQTFSAKALGGIDYKSWGDTVPDRSIPVILHKYPPNNVPEPLYWSDAQEAAARGLHDRLAAWVTDEIIEALSEREQVIPYMPELASPRAFASWKPLLAIAMLAGEGWRERAYSAAVALNGKEDHEASAGAQILAAIRDAFNGMQQITTVDLLWSLNARNDLPLDAFNIEEFNERNLPKVIRKYDHKIKPMPLSGTTKRGYRREWFVHLWEKYCPEGSTSEQASQASQASQPSSRAKFSATPTEHSDAYNDDIPFPSADEAKDEIRGSDRATHRSEVQASDDDGWDF
jgi:Protein of unknown function (DUF3631)